VWGKSQNCLAPENPMMSGTRESSTFGSNLSGATRHALLPNEMPFEQGLLAYAELLNHVFVRFGVVTLEVIEQTAALADEH
jgi:hypothetical protein